MSETSPKKAKSSGNAFYSARYRIGEYCLRGFVASFPWLPKSILHNFTRVGARVSYLLLWRYRQRMRENVATTMSSQFPTVEEQKRLVRRAWNNFAEGLYETASSIFMSPEELRSRIQIEGEEHLRQALAKKKGVIALSAHLGSFTLIGPRLAAAGYSFSVVVKLPRDERSARLQNSYRARVGVATISARPRRQTVREVLKALRANRVILMIADEFKSVGVQVNFLGRPVPAPRGPVTIALRTGAAVVPMFLVRDAENHLTLLIRPEIEVKTTGDSQKDLLVNAAVFVAELEEMVRRYPDQWNWLGFSKSQKKKKRKQRATVHEMHPPEEETKPATETSERPPTADGGPL